MLPASPSSAEDSTRRRQARIARALRTPLLRRFLLPTVWKAVTKIRDACDGAFAEATGCVRLDAPGDPSQQVVSVSGPRRLTEDLGVLRAELGHGQRGEPPQLFGHASFF